MICGGGNAINDYCDRKIDKINRPERPIPSGRLKAGHALVIGRFLFMIGVLLSVQLGELCIILAILNSLVLAFYAAELKRISLVGNLTVGYLVGSTFLFGGLAAKSAPKFQTNQAVSIQAVGILAAMAALSTIGRELIKDIEDMKGDKKIGLKTFPLRHGTRAAAALAIAFIAAAIALSPLPYLLNLFGNVYLVLVTISVLIFIWAAATVAKSQNPKAAGLASLACKVGMGLGLLAFLADVIAHMQIGEVEAFISFILLAWIIWFIITILLCVWVYQDAKARGESGVLWLIVILIAGIIGLIIWLIVRPKKKVVE
jgi:geranylgeranylglycerol-phosphate geranylgeranyltransferase